MSRKHSHDIDLSMSARLPYSDKFGDSLYESKKYQTYLDRFSSSPIMAKNVSNQNSFSSGATDFSGVRKLPDDVSSIRETFSFNQPESIKHETQLLASQPRSKNSRLNDLLAQAMDLKASKIKQPPKLDSIIQSDSVNLNVINYPKIRIQVSDKSYSTVDDFKQAKLGNSFDFRQLGTKSPIENRTQKSYTASVQEEIKKLREQNYLKKSSSIRQQADNEEATSPYLKSYSTSSEIKDSFSKKSYFEYYSPKIEKSISENTTYQFNTLSPPYQKRRKQSSFEVRRQSPKILSDVPNIKNLLDIPSIKISLEVPSPTMPRSRKNSSFSNTKRLLTDKFKIEDFEIGKKLGQGRFGTAYLAFHKSTGGVFAIKMVKKEMIKQNKLVEQFILQVKLQSYLQHPFILKIYGIFDDEQTIYLVMEYLPQGTLFNYFKNSKNKRLNEQDAAEKIKYLAQSIKYLQDRGIAHRDIKPQNIIMSNNVCKLADFGWATFCDEERRKTYCGTCDYVAPEILQGEEYDESVDLWCIGVLAYQLIAGKAPFYHMSQKQTRNKIMNVSVNYPQQFSESLKSFLTGLIQKNPQQRMSIEQVLAHPFLKDVKLTQ